jgi:hypothetical protein
MVNSGLAPSREQRQVHLGVVRRNSPLKRHATVTADFKPVSVRTRRPGMSEEIAVRPVVLAEGV